MIRVEGRNILDEGFSGSNARDMNTGKMSSEAAKFLSDTIKDAISPITASIKTNKVVIAQTASNMAKTIAENTKEFQTIIESSGEETQQEFIKLLTMMNDAQKKTGDASIAAMQDVVKQIEKLKKADTSGKLSDTLDLNKRQEEIAKPLGRQSVFGAAFKKFTNVDLRKESALQALSPTKLFGLNPSTSDIIKSVQADSATRGSTNALGKLGAALIPNNQKRNKTTVAPKVKNAEGGRVFTTGIDRESLENKQVELLEQILAQLKEMGGGGFSAKSILDKLTPAAIGSVLMQGLKAARILGPLAVLKDVFDIVAGTDGGANLENVGGVTAGVIGGVAGFMLGGPPGAMIGAGIGNAIGDIMGSTFDDMWANRERGPERIRRTAGGRETITDAPLSYSERQDMEEYGTIDREEIQRIQTERAGYSQPDVVQSTPMTQLSTQEMQNSQRNNPAFIQAIKNMPPAQKEIFLEQNPHLRSAVESQSETLENPRQSTEPDMLTIPGSGVLSPEAQGMTPQVTPTGDAVNNMTEAYRQMVSNVTNIFNNTTNNNGSGPQPQPIIVSSPSVRNNDNSFRFFQHSNK
jgi:hypothetical protein